MDFPIYIATVTDNSEGINCISFVTEPAVESNFLQFAKQKEILKFNILDSNNRKVIAPIMRADFPIYRKDESGFQYYVKYTKEAIEVMARKMLADNVASKMNQQHNPNNPMYGVYLEELFIKDSSKGISPKGFEDIEEYSLFGVYSIENDNVWQDIQSGIFKGISLEGVFTLELAPQEETEKDLLEEILSMLKQIKK